MCKCICFSPLHFHWLNTLFQQIPPHGLGYNTIRSPPSPHQYTGSLHMYAVLGKITGYVTCMGHRYGWVHSTDLPSSTATFSFFKLFLARSSTSVTAPSLPSSW